MPVGACRLAVFLRYLLLTLINRRGMLSYFSSAMLNSA